jgi:hypothetical protein
MAALLIISYSSPENRMLRMDIVQPMCKSVGQGTGQVDLQIFQQRPQFPFSICHLQASERGINKPNSPTSKGTPREDIVSGINFPWM